MRRKPATPQTATSAPENVVTNALLYSGRGAPRILCCFCRAEQTEFPVRSLFDGSITCGAHPEEQERSDEMRRLSQQQFVEKNLPFDLHRGCPKCGNEHRTVEYHNGRHDLSIYGPTPVCWSQIWPHILRNCGVCGHHDVEVPLDFAVETP